MNLISTNTIHHANDYASRFCAAEPFRHVVIDEFLDAEFCRRLSTDFPGFEDRHALNEMGQVGGKAVRMDVRDISDAFRELDQYLQTPDFLDFVSKVTSIPDLIYDPDYIGGGTHENRHGQGLDAHVDFNYHPRTKWHRRLNLIVYLNDEWDPAWGGELELQSDPWDTTSNRTISICPLMNKAVIFETTETSWHGFSSIQLPEDRHNMSRRSFAIYLYTRQRPDQETAAPHATIYVPEMMPIDWKAGRNLVDADVMELRNRFGRLRTQLRYLYEREKHFGAQIAKLESALVEARRSQRLELQGFATQPRGTTGLWDDGWASLDLDAVFTTTRKAKYLELELWAPQQLEADQELRIVIAGSAYTQLLVRGKKTTARFRLQAAAGSEIKLQILASHVWVPADTGESADERELAYKIVRAMLDH